MGTSPPLRRSILPASTSTQTTWLPASARQAPVTKPTYPEPKIVTRIAGERNGRLDRSQARSLPGLTPGLGGKIAESTPASGHVGIAYPTETLVFSNCSRSRYTPRDLRRSKQTTRGITSTACAVAWLD